MQIVLMLLFIILRRKTW